MQWFYLFLVFWKHNENKWLLYIFFCPQNWSLQMICCKHVLCGRNLMCMYDTIFNFLNLYNDIRKSYLGVWTLWSYYALFNSPVMLRKFDSGVMVIQNKSHSDEEVIHLNFCLILIKFYFVLFKRNFLFLFFGLIETCKMNSMLLIAVLLKNLPLFFLIVS